MRKLKSKCCGADYERLFPYYPGKEGSLAGELYCKKCGERCEVEEKGVLNDKQNKC